MGHHAVATRSSSSEAATATQSGDVGGGSGAIEDAAKRGHRTIECGSGLVAIASLGDEVGLGDAARWGTPSV